MIALLVDFRLRILTAALIALLLFATGNTQIKFGAFYQKLIHYLGTISYSLFLVHFSVVMTTNAIFSWLALASPIAGIFFMLVSWILSLILADFFYKRIEKPTTTILKFNKKADQQHIN